MAASRSSLCAAPSSGTANRSRPPALPRPRSTPRSCLWKWVSSGTRSRNGRPRARSPDAIALPSLPVTSTKGPSGMKQVMNGVRVLEVAQFVFVPAAGAVLAEWGADVIKVEHPVRGDTQRGMLSIAGAKLDPVVNPMIEHPNRGKRSIGIDVATPEGQALIYKQIGRAHV